MSAHLGLLRRLLQQKYRHLIPELEVSSRHPSFQSCQSTNYRKKHKERDSLNIEIRNRDTFINNRLQNVYLSSIVNVYQLCTSWSTKKQKQKKMLILQNIGRESESSCLTIV